MFIGWPEDWVTMRAGRCVRCQLFASAAHNDSVMGCLQPVPLLLSGQIIKYIKNALSSKSTVIFSSKYLISISCGKCVKIRIDAVMTV